MIKRLSLFALIFFATIASAIADEPIKSRIDLQWQEAHNVVLIRGTTNLPDGMQLDFHLAGPRGTYDTQNHATVKGGAFETRGFYGNGGAALPRGQYKLTVSTWGIPPQVATPGARSYSGPPIVNARAESDGQKILPQVWEITLR